MVVAEPVTCSSTGSLAIPIVILSLESRLVPDEPCTVLLTSPHLFLPVVPLTRYYRVDLRRGTLRPWEVAVGQDHVIRGLSGLGLVPSSAGGFQAQASGHCSGQPDRAAGTTDTRWKSLDGRLCFDVGTQPSPPLLCTSLRSALWPSAEHTYPVLRAANPWRSCWPPVGVPLHPDVLQLP